MYKIFCIDPYFENYYAGDNYKRIYQEMISEYDLEKIISTSWKWQPGWTYELKNV